MRSKWSFCEAGLSVTNAHVAPSWTAVESVSAYTVEAMLILDPTAESTIPKLTLAARRPTLKGKKIWFLDNQGQAWEKGEPRMNPVFLRWAERLEADYGIRWEHVCTQQFTAPFRHGKDKFEQIAKDADVIINGLACCGSGTSAVIHDAIQYELRGIPTVSLVTDSVLGHAKAATMKLGMPGLPILTVSHNVHMFAPVCTPEESVAAADAIYAALAPALVQGQ